MSDDKLYRVNLICACNQDITYGYGETEEKAREVAEREFRDHNRDAEFNQIVVERATATHYETDRVIVRMTFPPTLAGELREWAVRVTDGVFESSDENDCRKLLDALKEIGSLPIAGRGGRAIQQAAQTRTAKLRPILKVLFG